ncbi:MAG: ligase-associated DNA damage response DEXH box helicase, partial [Pseudomonadota bacterium]
MVDAFAQRESTLLIAPTGAGKTLAGFLPSLIDMHTSHATRSAAHASVHTLYISPLKALAVDVARNVMTPAEEMALNLRIETRTGDTPPARRQRQMRTPPDILLTTPEQLALLLSHPSAAAYFADLKLVVLDELHSLVTSKRGDLLSLDLARLRSHAPEMVSFGLSATVARPTELQAYLAHQSAPDTVMQLAARHQVFERTEPRIEILESGERLPWSGHSARYAFPEIYEAIRAHKLTLVFVNTRSQAEIVFQGLWAANDDALPIALHHGSLDVGQRRKVEAAMVAGGLRAVVCTSTLDLGIDWGDVDLVVNVGAPKGASRLAQRIGRANHRFDEPSKALLVPANRFEVMECRAALDAATAGVQDTQIVRAGGLDVLAQHVTGTACAGPFDRNALFHEVRSALPYSGLARDRFDRIIDFVSTGGYALKAYDRFARLRENADGLMELTHPRFAQQYRLNVGTIIEAPMLKVRLGRARKTGSAAALVGGKVLGEIEEWFTEQLTPGDTFIFAGQILRYEGMKDTSVFVSRSTASDPSIPSYAGGKFPLSTHLAARVRHMLAHSESWGLLPDQVEEWLRIQQEKSVVPHPDEILIETFPRGDRHYLICYPFEGRLAHQTLGVLLTRRLDRARARPLGFVANDYAIAIWGLGDMSAMIGDGR